MRDQPPPSTVDDIKIIDVTRLLELLVQDLYGSDPHLTLRELVQNSHDAIVELPPGPTRDAGRIAVEVNVFTDPYYIEVSDTGAGMSRERMGLNLGAIGDTTKLGNPNTIGRFGIGFLSCFIIANHVEVVSRQPGSPTTCIWVTKDKRRYTLTETYDHQFAHGTRVRLYFRDTYPAEYVERINEIRSTEGVERVLTRFCYLIPMPITVRGKHDEGQPRRINAINPPWDSQSEAAAAFRVLFARNEPLYTHRFSEQDPNTGYSAQGVLYFRGELALTPSLQLYVMRLLVDPEDTRLVPAYAAVVQGIVECPKLAVDLGRRSISEFDPPYKWLRAVVARQYERAFVKFASTQVDDFFAFWPNVDQTIISRLLRALGSDDPVVSSAAESFLVAAAPFIPFYVVNTMSGAQGRPMWKMISEMVDSVPLPPDGKVTIRYSDSTNPVEKDMLINTYREFIDVGRADRPAHEALMTQIYALNDAHARFRVEKVSASRFDSVDDHEVQEWRPVLERVRSDLIFFGRSHEVVLERYSPDSTPVVITDSTVDKDVIATLRDRISSMGGDPNSDAVTKQIVALLDNMKERGGVLTIHLNANNGLLRKLSSVFDTDLREVAMHGLMTICWRAVLDYFGWNSTRDMLAKDKRHTHEVISALLEVREREASLLDRCTRLETEANELKQEVAALRPLASNAAANRSFMGIIGFIDIVDSTRKIIGNPSAGPVEASRFIQLLVAGVRDHIAAFATPVGFTGDGLQFCIEAEARSSGLSVRTELAGLPYIVEALCTRDGDLRAIVEKTLADVPKLRIALAYGQLIQAPVVSASDLIGLPAVEASRLCAKKNLYEGVGHHLLATKHAVNAGANWDLWKATDFTHVDEIRLEGLENAVVSIFRLSQRS